MLKSAVGVAHEQAVFKRRVQVLSDHMVAYLPNSGIVLDVGTGDGTIASRWTRARPGISVEGIDLMVRKRTAIPVRKFNGLDIPYPDKSVDVVTFVDVLHHADSISTLLSEARRVARRSVVIKDHLAENWFDHATLRFMDWVGNAPHGVVLPYNYKSFGEWGGYFREAALSIVAFDKAIPLYPPPFSLLFGRNLHFIAELKPL